MICRVQVSTRFDPGWHTVTRGPEAAMRGLLAVLGRQGAWARLVDENGRVLAGRDDPFPGALPRGDTRGFCD